MHRHPSTRTHGQQSTYTSAPTTSVNKKDASNHTLRQPSILSILATKHKKQRASYTSTQVLTGLGKLRMLADGQVIEIVCFSKVPRLKGRLALPAMDGEKGMRVRLNAGIQECWFVQSYPLS